MKPLLIIISAPSGTGKSTLCDRLLADFPEISYSISCTTRKLRGREEDGVDYYFTNHDDFEKRISRNDLLEHAIVHDNYYGTLKAPVYEAFRDGQSILLDIDVVGAEQIRDVMEDLPDDDPLKLGFVDIFIEPPSIEELRNRLEGRGEDSTATIELRLKNALGELDRADEYKYRVVNDDLDVAYRKLCDIIMVNLEIL